MLYTYLFVGSLEVVEQFILELLHDLDVNEGLRTFGTIIAVHADVVKKLSRRITISRIQINKSCTYFIEGIIVKVSIVALTFIQTGHRAIALKSTVSGKTPSNRSVNASWKRGNRVFLVADRHSGRIGVASSELTETNVSADRDR